MRRGMWSLYHNALMILRDVNALHRPLRSEDDVRQLQLLIRAVHQPLVSGCNALTDGGLGA